MTEISAGATTRSAAVLGGRTVAAMYLLAIGLTETLAVWAEPLFGFALYGLILVLLALQATFDPEGEVRRLCVALALVPLIRLAGFSIPWGALQPVAQYLILATVMLAAVAMLLHYLGLRPRQIGLRLGEDLVGVVGYLPVVLVTIPLGLIEYHLLRPPPLVTLATPIQSVAVMQIASLWLGFVEAMIFYGVVLHLSREALGDWASVTFVALMYALLQVGHLSWQYGVLAFTSSLVFGWVVLRTRTIYAVALAQGFTKLLLLVAPLLFVT